MSGEETGEVRKEEAEAVESCGSAERDTQGNPEAQVQKPVKVKKIRKLIRATGKVKKVREFGWVRFNPGKTCEFDYLKTFLRTNEGSELDLKALGLEGEEEGKKSKKHAFNSSNELLLNVAENIRSRLTMQGGLDSEANFIKRRRHNNDNFYEQDEFIDDDAEGEVDNFKIQHFVSKFSDYFFFAGSKEEFEESSRFKSLVGEISEVQKAATRKKKKIRKPTNPDRPAPSVSTPAAKKRVRPKKTSAAKPSAPERPKPTPELEAPPCEPISERPDFYGLGSGLFGGLGVTQKSAEDQATHQNSPPGAEDSSPAGREPQEPQRMDIHAILAQLEASKLVGNKASGEKAKADKKAAAALLRQTKKEEKAREIDIVKVYAANLKKAFNKKKPKFLKKIKPPAPRKRKVKRPVGRPKGKRGRKKGKKPPKPNKSVSLSEILHKRRLGLSTENQEASVPLTLAHHTAEAANSNEKTAMEIDS